MAIDNDLMFRRTSNGNLTTDEAGTTHILDLGEGTPLAGKPLWAWVRVPTTAAASTLAIRLQFDNDSALGSIDYFMELASISAAGFYSYPFASRRRYVGMDFNNSGTTSWGAVEAGITDSDPRARSET